MSETAGGYAQKAELCLKQAKRGLTYEETMSQLVEAQVYATLALAAATTETRPGHYNPVPLIPDDRLLSDDTRSYSPFDKDRG